MLGVDGLNAIGGWSSDRRRGGRSCTPRGGVMLDG